MPYEYHVPTVNPDARPPAAIRTYVVSAETGDAGHGKVLFHGRSGDLREGAAIEGICAVIRNEENRQREARTMVSVTFTTADAELVDGDSGQLGAIIGFILSRYATTFDNTHGNGTGSLRLYATGTIRVERAPTLGESIKIGAIDFLPDKLQAVIEHLRADPAPRTVVVVPAANDTGAASIDTATRDALANLGATIVSAATIRDAFVAIIRSEQWDRPIYAKWFAVSKTTTRFTLPSRLPRMAGIAAGVGVLAIVGATSVSNGAGTWVEGALDKLRHLMTNKTEPAPPPPPDPTAEIALCDRLAGHKLDPELKDVEPRIGIMLSTLMQAPSEDLRSAFQACTDARRLAPDHPRTAYNLARVLWVMHDQAGTLNLLEAVPAIRSPMARAFHADILREQGKLTQARAALTTLLSSKPDLPGPSLELAAMAACGAGGDVDRPYALTLARRAVSLSAGYPHAPDFATYAKATVTVIEQLDDTPDPPFCRQFKPQSQAARNGR